MQYEALRALTGQPVVLYQTSKQSEDDVWNTLSSDIGFIKTASCLQDLNGLRAGNAYTILGTLELKTK